MKIQNAMKKYLTIMIMGVCLAACDSVFRYHPYDVRINGDRDINARNIERIETA